MYDCSNAFHAAVAAGNKQIALLIFNDCVFTDDDIVIDQGIEFDDNFNTEEDISIGQTPSNEIRFSLVNENRLLNSYPFGDFTATIGVYTGDGTVYTKNTNETCRAVYGGNTYVGYNVYPYVKRNATPVSSQPSWAIQSMICYDGKVYVFGPSGQYMVYTDATGGNETSSHTIGGFMTNKGKNWNGLGFSYVNRQLNVYDNGHIRKYEFCPLGKFTADRPKAPDKIQIDMTCFDFMQKFEKDMTEVTINFGNGGITLRNLFIALCGQIGVEYELPSTFINGDAVILSRPEDFDNCTARDVLKWIGEASGTNARFNRDGKLILDWIRTNTASSEVFGANGYSEFDPYWYETKRVGTLYNRSTQDSSDSTKAANTGYSGSEYYLIQDNPFLRGVSS